MYFESPITSDVLGPQVNIAQVPKKNIEAISALYAWLGVAEEPRPRDVIKRITQITSDPPTPSKIEVIEQIFLYLASKWNFWSEAIQSQYSPLKNGAWLPGTKQNEVWCKPKDVYAVFQSYLFESQGNFLKFDINTQRKNGELIRFLGINREPETEQVVQHLLYSSKRGETVNKQVYIYLTQNVSDPSIAWLDGKACLLLQTESGEEYFAPDHVFWEEHPFGRFRYRLGPEFGQYKPLFDKLNVQESPDSQDAINVLLEISESPVAVSNFSVTSEPDLEQVIFACWRLLSKALEAEEISPSNLKESLSDKKTIPSTRGLLSRPEYLFFEDRPGWADNFELIKGNITERIEGAWPAMEAAGVRRLSKAITTALHSCDNPREDLIMRTRLAERKILIQRVIEAHRVRDMNIDRVDELSFAKADNLEIVRSFYGFGRHERHLENVDAVRVDGTLYFCSDNGYYPWIGIARELGYVLQSAGELSILGMELKEIISTTTLEEANDTLDHYGYPRLTAASDEPAEGQTIQDLGGADEIPDDPDLPGDSPDTAPTIPTGGGQSGSPQPPSVGTKPKGKQASTKRKTSRLVSYVYPDDALQEKTTETTQASRHNEIGQLGVDKVMQYERDQGWDPTDMETIQVHHPGFDVKSVNEQNPREVRYIEVKSTSGVWDSQNPAQMTKTEFETAKEYGESFWLYIVEQVESDNPKLYCIQNPANQANYYLFDHGWEPLAKVTDNFESN